MGRIGGIQVQAVCTHRDLNDPLQDLLLIKELAAEFPARNKLGNIPGIAILHHNGDHLGRGAYYVAIAAQRPGLPGQRGEYYCCGCSGRCGWG